MKVMVNKWYNKSPKLRHANKLGTLMRLPSQRTIGEHIAAYVLLAPAILLLGAWFVYPIVSSFILSFQEVNIFHYFERGFIGLKNFLELIHDPVFHSTMRITATFVLLVVPIQSVLSLLASIIVQNTGRAKTFFRTAFFIPYVTSTVAVTSVFMNIFTIHSFIPSMLSKLGIPDVSWYADIRFALVFLAIIYVWMNIGLYMIIFLSGLQTIPKELFEAATVDGANSFQVLRYITVPSLRPFTFFVLVAGMIQAFQIFDQAYVISGGTILGGPAGATSTIVIFIFSQAFRYNKLGYASAAAIIFLILVLAATVLLRRIFKEETYGSS